MRTLLKILIMTWVHGVLDKILKPITARYICFKGLFSFCYTATENVQIYDDTINFRLKRKIGWSSTSTDKIFATMNTSCITTFRARAERELHQNVVITLRQTGGM